MRFSQEPQIPSTSERRAYQTLYRAAQEDPEQQIEKLRDNPVHKLLFEIRTRARLIFTLKKLLTDTDTFARELHLDALDQFLRSISNKDVFNAWSMWDDISLKTGGRAIAPAHAANVLQDTTRTCTFARGLHDAILELKKRFPNEQTLRILYAGTGPFATLALPSMATFSPEEVKFDLLEIQSLSFQNAQRVMQICGFQDHCEQFLEKDATTFKPTTQYHAIITETMGPGLAEEPQISIMENLRDSLIEGGIMIPEEIRMGLMLFRNETDERRFPGLWTWPPPNGETSGAIQMSCPFEFEREARVVVASYAEIYVFGGNKLELGNCSLSRPVPLGQIQNSTGNANQMVHVAYKPGTSLLFGENPDLCELR